MQTHTLKENVMLFAELKLRQSVVEQTKLICCKYSWMFCITCLEIKDKNKQNKYHVLVTTA